MIEEFGRRLLPGPYPPTVLTSAVVASLPDEPSLGELLSAFVDGATGALVRRRTHRHPRRRRVDRRRLLRAGAGTTRGRHRPCQAAVDAEQSVWFRLTPAPSATIHVDGVDLTRSVGQITFAQHRRAGRCRPVTLW